MPVPNAFTRRTVQRGTVAAGYAHRAALTTELAGDDNDLIFRAVNGGTAGNSIRVRYVVSGNDTPLTVAVSGNDITVNVETDDEAAATSTAAQVRDAVNAHVPAARLVTAADAADNDGTGTVAALAFTALSGGTSWTLGSRL